MVPFQWYHTYMVGINRNVRNNSSKRHQNFSFWELTVTVCGEKEPQTHSRNRLYFQLSFIPFFKNVKELGETLIFGLSKKYQNPEIEFYVIFVYDVNTSGVDYAKMWIGGPSSLR